MERVGDRHSNNWISIVDFFFCVGWESGRIAGNPWRHPHRIVTDQSIVKQSRLTCEVINFNLNNETRDCRICTYSKLRRIRPCYLASILHEWHFYIYFIFFAQLDRGIRSRCWCSTINWYKRLQHIQHLRYYIAFNPTYSRRCPSSLDTKIEFLHDSFAHNRYVVFNA